MNESKIQSSKCWPYTQSRGGERMAQTLHFPFPYAEQTFLTNYGLLNLD